MKNVAVPLGLRGLPICLRTGGIVLSILLNGLLPGAMAGTLSTGFEPGEVVPGALYGLAAVDVAGGVNNSGVLKMNTANGQAGFFVSDDLDGGQTVGSFVATFSLRTGSDTSTVLHGDGLSFTFGPDIPDDVFALPEEGIGSGLRISFDTFNNGGPANEAPAIEVTFGNLIIATKRVEYLSTGKGYVPIKIEVHPEGTLDLVFGTNAVFTGLLCYAPTPGRFSLAASAGAERFVGDPVDLYWVDNLAITTKVSQAAFIQAVTPRGDSVSPDAAVVIQVQDAGTHADRNSVQLKFDNAIVTAAVTQGAAGVTIISYDPPGLLEAGSTHGVTLSYVDDAVPPKTNTVSYSFTVDQYVTLTAANAVSPATVDTNSLGFKVRTEQIGVDVGTSVERAELQFAGKLVNPLDGSILPNTADLSGANPDGTFDQTDGIDFTTGLSPSGFFSNDALPPGVVGTDQYALEITTYLQLAAGPYTFGVNAVRNYNTTAPGSFRESGFRLTTGPNPRDLFAPEVAVFDNGRPEGETRFSFLVQQPGIYPFRLLWFSGVGASDLEWYQIMPDGKRVLIGDASNGGLTAYRDATVTHPYVQFTTAPKPGETSVAANSGIHLTLVDGSATVKKETIQLNLDGLVVTPNVTQAGSPGLTQLSFQPSAALLAGSTNTVRLKFTDNAGSGYDQSWIFVVEGTAAIPGLVAVEAEHFSTNTPIDSNGTSWDLSTNVAGFSGDGAMVANPNVNLNVNVDTTISPRLDYNLNFPVAGKYYVWIRAYGDSAPGISQNDSVNVGLDGVLPDTSAKITGFPPGGYVWSRTTVASAPATMNVPTAGPHVVNVWMREDGFVFDKVLFTTNSSYTPVALGPAETTGTIQSDRPTLTFVSTGSSLKLSWTGAGLLQAASDVTGPYSTVPGGSISPVIVNLDQPRRFFRVLNQN